MVLIKYIRLFLLFIFLTLAGSCEDEGFFVDCAECGLPEPANVYLRIKLTQISGGAYIRIYAGNLENNILLTEFQTYSETTFQQVSLNRKYTITARYVIDNDEIFAVNSATPRVKLIEDKCSEPCYYIYGKDADLRLKYD